MARKREGREKGEADGDLARALVALTERVARLEARAANGAIHGPIPFDANGATGDETDAVFAAPPEGAMRVLAALSSAPRLALYRAALAGPVTSAELMMAAGLNTTGQLYHHLRELVGVGLMTQEGRDRYAAVRDRLPAARAILRAAHAVAGVPVLPALPGVSLPPPADAPEGASP